MVLLIPGAIVLGLMGLCASLYVWIQCASVDIVPAIIMCIVTVVVFGLLILWGILKSKKTDKPYYYIPVVIIFFVGVCLFAFQSQIFDFYTSIFAQIGPGSLPSTQLN